MAGDNEKRKKLVGFLDRRAFDPVLRKSADDFSGRQRNMFEDVKRSTESEKQRFHNEYKSARDVKDNYLSDLTSQAGKKKSSELEELGLPSLPQLKDEFVRLCDDLDV